MTQGTEDYGGSAPRRASRKGDQRCSHRAEGSAGAGAGAGSLGRLGGSREGKRRGADQTGVQPQDTAAESRSQAPGWWGEPRARA